MTNVAELALLLAARPRRLLVRHPLPAMIKEAYLQPAQLAAPKPHEC